MLGIIGGSGLYSLEELEDIRSEVIRTPFGAPSAPVMKGSLAGNQVAFIPRHGLHHQILPSEINYCANIWALKSVGVRTILAVSAVGSLRETLSPGTFALPTQYLDWTKGKRRPTFFGDGLVAHVSLAEPTCDHLREEVLRIARNLDIKITHGQTYGCVEGPRFGTRAESFFLRDNGCDLVGMTNVPEAFLAREAELCYTTLAIITDYDCWRDEKDSHANAHDIIALYQQKMGQVKEIIVDLVKGYRDRSDCSCRSALEAAVMSDLTGIDPEKRAIYDFLTT